MKNKILPVFISFAGCTSRCIYCNQNKITGIKSSDVIKSAENQINENLKYDVQWSELAYYGGSFSCLPADIRHGLYELAHNSGINRLRFSTSPDCISEDILTEAVDNRVKTIELGVQSLDDLVLKANKRPYDSAQFMRSYKLVREHVETVGIQLMTGLHKETFDSFAETVDKAVMLNADYARIYPCVVLAGTELAELHEHKEYVPLTIAEAVARCAYGYILLTASGCEVIRIGLQDSDSVRESALAGAYHPAMGDMAKTVAMQTYFFLGGKIQVDPSYINIAYGYGGILKNMHNGQIEIKAGEKPDFSKIAKAIKENLGEDYKRKLQEQTHRFAERLISETNDR